MLTSLSLCYYPMGTRRSLSMFLPPLSQNNEMHGYRIMNGGGFVVCLSPKITIHTSSLLHIAVPSITATSKLMKSEFGKVLGSTGLRI